MIKVKEWKSEREKAESEEFEKARRKKIIDAINSAKIRHRWDYSGLRDSSVLFGTQNDWNKTLVSKILEVNKEFGGNGVICSSEVSAILMDSIHFTPGDNMITTESFNFLGMLDYLPLFVDIFLPSSFLLIIRGDFFTSEHPECAVIYVDGIPGL